MVFEAVEKFQRRLYSRTSKADSISWSWVCVKLLNLISNYPSGITEAIILSELHSELIKSGGRLSKLHSQYRTASISGILDTRAVNYESVLQVIATNPREIPGTTTKIVHLVDPDNGARHLGMYLHRKFYELLHILMTHTLRMTCCHLKGTAPASSTGHPQQLHLLPTEHIVVLLKDDELPETEQIFSPLWPNIQSVQISQPNYIRNIFTKVADICKEEIVHTPDGFAFRRLIVYLDYADDERIPLVLWDSYIGFSRLFDKGDVLFIEKPYAKPSGDNSFCLEYGPATVIYVAPYKPQQEIIPSQHPKQAAPISMKKTEDGKLDCLSYPERLSIADIVPNMINGVMLVMCKKLEKKVFVAESSNAVFEIPKERFLVEVCDNTGSIKSVVTDPGLGMYETIYPSQWLLMTGLSSADGDEGLELHCSLGNSGGTILNVCSLPGWLMSPALYTSVPLKTVSQDENHFGGDSWFICVAKVIKWCFTSSDASPVKPVHCTCRNEVTKEHDGVFYCKFCSMPNLVHFRPETSAGLRDDSWCWRWEYSIDMCLKDESATINASVTSTTMEMLLQKSPMELNALSTVGAMDLMSGFSDREMVVSLTKVDTGTLLVNCVAFNV